MNPRLESFLQRLAATRGRRPYAPLSSQDDDLRSFQDEVDEIERLGAASLLVVVGTPHRESRTGKRYIDRITIELTAEGVARFAPKPNAARHDEPPGTTAVQFDEQLSELKQAFAEKVLLPLQSDSRAQGMNAYAAWRAAFLSFLEQYLPADADRFRKLTTQSEPHANNQKENAYHRFMREEGRICLTLMETLKAGGKTDVATGKSSPKIFLSYAREDLDAARRLYQQLVARGQTVWFDREALRPGENWRVAVTKAIRESQYFIALLSAHSLTKIGYVQKELKDAFDILAEHPIASVFIIPAPLDDCKPADDPIRNLHWVDLFEDWDAGVERICHAIMAAH